MDWRLYEWLIDLETSARNHELFIELQLFGHREKSDGVLGVLKNRRGGGGCFAIPWFEGENVATITKDQYRSRRLDHCAAPLPWTCALHWTPSRDSSLITWIASSDLVACRIAELCALHSGFFLLQIWASLFAVPTDDCTNLGLNLKWDDLPWN